MTTGGNATVGETLKALLFEPGFLTEEVLAGRRARWLAPLWMFLIVSVSYFVAAAGVTRFAGPPVEQAALKDRVEITPDARAALEKAGAKALLGEDRFNRITSDIGAVGVQIGTVLAEVFARLMFALLPVFAFLTWLAWRGDGKTYLTHLYFALHVHAAWFAALLASKVVELSGSTFLEIIVGLGALIYSTWYVMVALKRVLGGSNMQLAVRSTLVGVVYGLLSLVGVFAAAANAVLNY